MIDKRVFVGGMDSDTDDRLVAQGDYRRALNLRVVSSSGDSVGAAQNIIGNKLVLNTKLPSGRNKCIGVHRSEDRDSVIYFLFNSLSNHGIYEYSFGSNEVLPILINGILNFKERSLITGIADIEGLLYWTDDDNHPRKLNISKARLHTLSNGLDPNGYGTSLIFGDFLEREKYVNAIKAQPVNAPELGFFTDTTRSTNRVRGKFLRFRYRYVYDDNERSAWSEPSVISYTLADFIGSSSDLVFSPVGSSTSYVEVQRFLNGVRLTVDSSHETVVAFEVSVAEGYNDFFFWRRFSKEGLGIGDNESFSVEYFGDSVLTPLDINESIKPFDDLPQKAKALAIIEGNQLAYGNYVTGYDPIDIDVSLEPNYYPFEPFLNAEIGFGNAVGLDSFGFENLSEGVVGIVYQSAVGGGEGDGSVLVTADLTYRGRRRQITVDDFRNLLIAAGYDLVDNSAVQIAYSLGGTTSPDLSDSANLPPVSVIIPPLSGTDFVDAYAYLYDVLTTTPILPSLNGASDDFNDTIGGGGGLEYASKVSQAFFNAGLSTNGKFRFFDLVDFASSQATTFPVGVFASFAPFADGYFLFEQPSFISALTTGSRGVYSFALRSVPLDGDTFTTFKSGATHRFGLVYFDAYGRSGFANVSVDSEVYVNAIAERDIPEGSFDKLRASIRWQINHEPPSWATHYAWVYAGNDRTSDYLWVPILAPSNESGIVTGVPLVSEDGSAYNLSLFRLQQFQRDSIGDTFVSYSYSSGDRMQFVGNAPTLSQRPRRWRSESVIDVPILREQNASGELIVTVPNFGNTIAMGVAGSLVEIYKPRPNLEQEQRLYYTISPKYAIENGIHIVTQGEITRGDAYLRGRVYASPTPIDGESETLNPVYVTYVVESPSINDSSFSKFYDRGKAYTVDNDQGSVRYIDQVTYSAPFVVGSKINGLSDFNPVEQPFKEYGRIYGSIQRLWATDNKLEVYQEDAVQYSLVSRDVIYNNQGNGSSVGTLSQVLSDAITYEGEYGISTNPESWAQFGSRRYFADKKRGVVCRLSNDGITPISDYNMTTYFRDKFEAVLQSNRDGAIYGVYDARFAEYVVSIEDKERVNGTIVFSSILTQVFPLISILFDDIPPFTVGGEIVVFYEAVDGNVYELVLSSKMGDFNIVPNPNGEGFIFSGRPLTPSRFQGLVGGVAYYEVFNGETLAFSEKNNKWTTFYSFEPEFMSRLFNDICSFKKGQFYLHNAGEVNTFYDEYTPSELWVVSNAQPSLKKFYKALGLEGNAVFVPYELTTPSGQRSSLIAEDFAEREGYYYADILRDELTPSQEVDGEVLANALFEGDRVRDYSILIKLRNDSTSEVELFALNVVFEVSNLHGQEG